MDRGRPQLSARSPAVLAGTAARATRLPLVDRARRGARDGPAGDGDAVADRAGAAEPELRARLHDARRARARAPTSRRPPRRAAAIALGVALLIAALDRARGVARAGAPARALAPALAASARASRLLARAGGARADPARDARRGRSPRRDAGSGCDSRLPRRAAELAAARWWERRLPLGLAWLAQRFDTTPDLGEQLGASGAALAYRAGDGPARAGDPGAARPPPAPAASAAGRERASGRLLGFGVGAVLARRRAVRSHTDRAGACS